MKKYKNVKLQRYEIIRTFLIEEQYDEIDLVNFIIKNYVLTWCDSDDQSSEEYATELARVLRKIIEFFYEDDDSLITKLLKQLIDKMALDDEPLELYTQDQLIACLEEKGFSVTKKSK